MEFRFQISAYDAPALEAETAELLHQRLEAYSRKAVPGMWKVTDKLNAHAAKGPGRERRRHRVYGVLLILPGILVLVLGLMEPRTPVMIWLGSFMILSGVMQRFLAKEKKPLAPTAANRKEAARLLAQYRETGWETLRAEVRFDETGWTAATAEGKSRTPYEDLRNVFETERLWLLVDEKEQALLLQKKDLASGAAEDFLPFLRARISGGSAA